MKTSSAICSNNRRSYTCAQLALLTATILFATTGAALADDSLWFSYAKKPDVSLAPAPAFNTKKNALSLPEQVGSATRLPDRWTQATLDLIIKYQLNPLRAARVLAYVHAAMDDAMTLAVRNGLAEEAVVIGLHRAASTTLGYFFPQEAQDKIEAMGFAEITQLKVHAAISDAQAQKAWLTGNQVAAAAIGRARDDGADATWNPNNRPKAAPHIWRATPPLLIYNPAEPMAGTWQTWNLRDSAEIQPPPPLEYGSKEFWKEVEQVKTVTDKLTAEQKRIAEEWNLDLGTVSPGGVWNKVALKIAQEEKLNLRERLRLFAALDTALADAFIACWKAKYTWWSVRPISVIQEKLDPKFAPHILTPAFPSYPSGHATISGAASTVIGHFVPSRKSEVDRMAEQAALSRLYGGIHFTSDNDQGLELGRRIGNRAIERRLSKR